MNDASDLDGLDWHPPLPGPSELYVARRATRDLVLARCKVGPRWYEADPPIVVLAGQFYAVHYGYRDGALVAARINDEETRLVPTEDPEDAALRRGVAETIASAHRRIAEALGVPVEEIAVSDPSYDPGPASAGTPGTRVD